MKQWGLAKDEFTDNGNCLTRFMCARPGGWSATTSIPENDCRRLQICEDPIGLGSYNMDSHNVQRYVDDQGHARNEGDIQASPAAAMP